MSAAGKLEEAGHRVGHGLEQVVDETHAQADHARNDDGA